MITIIRNVDVYEPAFSGTKDVLIAGKTIMTIDDAIQWPKELSGVQEVDGTGKILVPGFIDGHVHILGGGGEGGFHTRTPELMLTDATSAGITTVVGVLGTDGVTRTMGNLVAKAKGLNNEGLNCFVQTGSYELPVRSLFPTIKEDLLYVEEIIGVGEVAIADHRSSQPTVQMLTEAASQARVGGMLSGKGGIVNVHLGDSDEHLRLIEEVVATTEIPVSQFWPTHINRNRHLFEAGIVFAKKGGVIDFTTSTIPKFLDEGEVKSSRAVKEALEAGVPVGQLTFTSDGQASLPYFDEHGKWAGMQVGKVSSLYEAFKECVLEENVPLEHALQVVTSNPARVLGLSGKGHVKEGYDADLVLLSASLEVDSVWCNGVLMVEKGNPVRRGTFESE